MATRLTWAKWGRAAFNPEEATTPTPMEMIKAIAAARRIDMVPNNWPMRPIFDLGKEVLRQNEHIPELEDRIAQLEISRGD